MSQERKRPGPTFWTLTLVILLILYPVSMGPANWVAMQAGSPQWMLTTLDVVYGPVIWLARHWPWFMNILNRWMMWWIPP